jgi:hypothetical protein
MPDVLVAAAAQEIVFSVSQLWAIAIGCGIAFAVAVGTLPLVSPRSRRMLGPGARFAVGLLTSSVCALFVLARSLGGNDEVTDALWIYIIAMLSLVVPRVIFTKWFTRAAEAQLAGKPIETSGGKVAVVVLVSMVAVVLSLFVFLKWLPAMWA